LTDPHLNEPASNDPASGGSALTELPSNESPSSVPTLRGPTLGGLTLKNPFLLAPMAGVTDWPYRLLCLEMGAAAAVSEMVSAVALSHRGRGTLKLLRTDPLWEKPFWVQLFGKDSESLALAAKMAVEEAGADLVDLNAACPARKVVSSGHGGALLKNPDLCCRLVEAMAKAVEVPVTVKLRPGFSPEDGPAVMSLGLRLADAGAKALILHGRYVTQQFGGEADWSLVEELASRVAVPVIGSGDITSADQAVKRLMDHHLPAVMIGRASRGRPWIFRECLSRLRNEEAPPASLRERLNAAARHARLLEEEIGPKVCFRLRTVLMWYTRDLPGAAKLRAGICAEEDVNRQLDMLTRAMEEAMEAEARDSEEDEKKADASADALADA
jgi:nifR3 family TIM-barrel protein